MNNLRQIFKASEGTRHFGEWRGRDSPANTRAVEGTHVAVRDLRVPSPPEEADAERVGGCLGRFWQAWARIGRDPWVTKVLRQGYQIPFGDALPPLSASSLGLTSHQEGSPRAMALELEITKLIQKGAVEEIVPPFPAGYYSRMLVVPRERATDVQS